MAAQLIHAAGESSPGNLSNETFAVCLAVPGEPELLALEARLIAAGIRHNSIREPDAPWNGQLMSIGICPCERSSVRKLLSNLPLLK
jgi:hypothetical protein